MIGATHGSGSSTVAWMNESPDSLAGKPGVEQVGRGAQALLGQAADETAELGLVVRPDQLGRLHQRVVPEHETTHQDREVPLAIESADGLRDFPGRLVAGNSADLVRFQERTVDAERS